MPDSTDQPFAPTRKQQRYLQQLRATPLPKGSPEATGSDPIPADRLPKLESLLMRSLPDPAQSDELDQALEMYQGIENLVNDCAGKNGHALSEDMATLDASAQMLSQSGHTGAEDILRLMQQIAETPDADLSNLSVPRTYEKFIDQVARLDARAKIVETAIVAGEGKTPVSPPPASTRNRTNGDVPLSMGRAAVQVGAMLAAGSGATALMKSIENMVRGEPDENGVRKRHIGRNIGLALLGAAGAVAGVVALQSPETRSSWADWVKDRAGMKPAVGR